MSMTDADLLEYIERTPELEALLDELFLEGGQYYHCDAPDKCEFPDCSCQPTLSGNKIIDADTPTATAKPTDSGGNSDG